MFRKVYIRLITYDYRHLYEDDIYLTPLGSGHYMMPKKSSRREGSAYFHGMFAMPCGVLLLQAPVLWLSGLPGPPEDSLSVPREGGLPAPAPTPEVNFCGADRSGGFIGFDSFCPSAIKLPTTTCGGHTNYCLDHEEQFRENQSYMSADK